MTSISPETVYQVLKKRRQTLAVADVVHSAETGRYVCARDGAGAGCVHRPARYDAEYERNGVAHLMLYYAPLENRRWVDVKTNHVATPWAEGVRQLVEVDFPEADKITLVMDNLNTHNGASLYKAFTSTKIRQLLDKLEFVYMPKHGSWLKWPNVSSVP